MQQRSRWHPTDTAPLPQAPVKGGRAAGASAQQRCMRSLQPGASSGMGSPAGWWRSGGRSTVGSRARHMRLPAHHPPASAACRCAFERTLPVGRAGHGRAQALRGVGQAQHEALPVGRRVHGMEVAAAGEGSSGGTPLLSGPASCALPVHPTQLRPRCPPASRGSSCWRAARRWSTAPTSPRQSWGTGGQGAGGQGAGRQAGSGRAGKRERHRACAPGPPLALSAPPAHPPTPT